MSFSYGAMVLEVPLINVSYLYLFVPVYIHVRPIKKKDQCGFLTRRRPGLCDLRLSLLAVRGVGFFL